MINDLYEEHDVDCREFHFGGNLSRQAKSWNDVVAEGFPNRQPDRHASYQGTDIIHLRVDKTQTVGCLYPPKQHQERLSWSYRCRVTPVLHAQANGLHHIPA